MKLLEGKVVGAAGPLADADLPRDDSEATIQLLGYLPYTERDGRWVSQHRDDFVREPHRGQLREGAGRHERD